MSSGTESAEYCCIDLEVNGGETRHEEVETRERYHVHRKLPQIGVQLAGKPEASGHAGHGQRDQMIQVPVAGIGNLEGAEADVVEGFVVDAVGLVCILHQLVHGEGGVVGLDHGVGYFRRRHHRVRVHNSVGVLLANLGDEQSAHPGSGTASEGMSQLEALQAVAVLALFSDHVQHRVDQFRALGVVTLGPIVARPGLAEHEIVGPEELPVSAGPYRVHGPWFQVQQNGSRHIFPSVRRRGNWNNRKRVIRQVDCLEENDWKARRRPSTSIPK